MSLTCIIIDDEPLAIEIIESHVEQYGGIEVVDTFQNAVAAFQALSRQPVDLIFLDIEMPRLSGLDLLRSLDKRPRVVLTTAHRDYAVEGFDLDVVDYLVKPVSFERFLKAMAKVERSLEGAGGEAAASTSSSGAVPADLVVRVDKKNVRVPLTDILYIESRRDYVHIVTNEDVIRTPYRIGDLASELRPAGFLRIHRSFIVPIRKLDAWSVSEVELGDTKLPIGRTYRHDVARELEEGR